MNHIFTETGFALENPDMASDEKDRLLEKIVSPLAMKSKEEIISVLWMAGKYKSHVSMSLLLRMADKINDHDVAWQYLVSCENMMGNSIAPAFSAAFGRIRKFSGEDARIRNALNRFHFQPESCGKYPEDEST